MCVCLCVTGCMCVGGGRAGVGMCSWEPESGEGDLPKTGFSQAVVTAGFRVCNVFCDSYLTVPTFRPCADSGRGLCNYVVLLFPKHSNRGAWFRFFYSPNV